MPANNFQTNSTKNTKNVSLPADRIKVTNLIRRERVPLKQGEIARRAHLTPARARKALHSLKANGILAKNGNGYPRVVADSRVLNP